MIWYYRVWEEIWWWLYKRSGWLWDKARPYDQASCWLDWLPAWAQGHYYKNLNKRRKIEEKQ